MGDLLLFPIERARRERYVPPAPPAFYFDPTSPLCYLAAERVERLLGEVDWVVVDGSATLSAGPDGLERLRTSAEAEARRLRLPLVWPEPFPVPAPGALRATAFACELGAGPAFALAASRLVFCGGFSLEDPETLAEAAAAAGVPLGPCLQAAGESEYDEALRSGARVLADAGIDTLPAFRIDGRWIAGGGGLDAAAALLAGRESAACSLAPVC